MFANLGESIKERRIIKLFCQERLTYIEKRAEDEIHRCGLAGRDAELSALRSNYIADLKIYNKYIRGNILIHMALFFSLFGEKAGFLFFGMRIEGLENLPFILVSILIVLWAVNFARLDKMRVHRKIISILASKRFGGGVDKYDLLWFGQTEGGLSKKYLNNTLSSLFLLFISIAHLPFLLFILFLVYLWFSWIYGELIERKDLELYSVYITYMYISTSLIEIAYYTLSDTMKFTFVNRKKKETFLEISNEFGLLHAMNCAMNSSKTRRTPSTN